MKVSKSQIEELYVFTQRHFVEWYDVQTELVDHLANGIEQQWEINPKKTFEEALKSEFKKFGVFGFNDLVEQKTKALNKYYRKQVWYFFKTYFKLPKIILTLFSIWLLNLVIHNLFDKTYLMVTIIAGVFIIDIYHLLKFRNKIKRRSKQTGRKWLFENSIIQLGGLIHFLNVGIWFQPLFRSNREWTDISELTVAICIVFYVLILYVSIRVVPEKLIEKMAKEHPEYILFKKSVTL